MIILAPKNLHKNTELWPQIFNLRELFVFLMSCLELHRIWLLYHHKVSWIVDLLSRCTSNHERGKDTQPFLHDGGNLFQMMSHHCLNIMNGLDSRAQLHKIGQQHIQHATSQKSESQDESGRLHDNVLLSELLSNIIHLQTTPFISSPIHCLIHPVKNPNSSHHFTMTPVRLKTPLLSWNHGNALQRQTTWTLALSP